MHVLAREPALLAIPEFLPNPVLELLDRVTTDAKLDEMQGHGDCRTFRRSGRGKWRLSPQRTQRQIRYRSEPHCIATARVPLLEIIARARHALLRVSEPYPQERFVYCAGAREVGGERAGAAAELGGCRAGGAADVGLRGEPGVSAAPVVSWGGGAAGSAVMMLTGGIEDADGK